MTKKITYVCATLAFALVSPSLFSQTDCEFLDMPWHAPGHEKRSKVIEVFQSIFESPELEMLTDNQVLELKAIRKDFDAIYTKAVGGLTSDMIEEYTKAINEADALQEAAAPNVIAELESIFGEYWPTVVFRINRKNDPFVLSTVVKGLKLTNDQLDEIKRLGTEVDLLKKTLQAELLEKQNSSLEEHFAAIKGELDSIQQARFLIWFGELKLFKDLFLSNRFRELVKQASDEADPVSNETVLEQTRFQNDGKILELPTERKDFEIDSILYRVLSMDNINETLMLSSSQVEQIYNQIHGNDIRLILKNRQAERMMMILEDKWQLPQWLDKILLPHQKDWMRQFEFQVYNAGYADSFGVLHPEVAGSLKLTGSTKKKILELARSYRNKMVELVKKAESTIAQAETEKTPKILNLLTPEQRLQYRLWFGE